MKLIVISGRSGSGKSISLHLLEDLGYYCIDNLPASLLPELTDKISDNYKNIAIGIDARNLPSDLDQFHLIIEAIRKQGHNLEIIYLDADDSTLLKRYSETRRKHPLSNKTVSLKEAIIKEKELLQPIAHLADLRIDTTHYTMYQLMDAIRMRINPNPKQLSLLIQSFGYKFGVPPDSDFVFDVRCLPNPYWLPELRPHTGLDQVIQDFILEKPQATKLLKDIEDFLTHWIPEFQDNNRSYMTISIGCTGGQHRSVVIAEKLNEHFLSHEQLVQIRHRELA